MSYWSVALEDGIAVATYSNPPMNYMIGPAVLELIDLVQDWQRDDVRVVILTGGIAGKFITHYSVEELIDLARIPADEMKAINRGYQDFVLGFRRLAKPVIVALNGDTMGGGFEIALGADIRIAQAGDHRIGLPEVRLGILPGGTGTQALSRLVGLARAAEFILCGRVVAPERARELGLVHEVVPDALARAKEVARDLVSISPYALAEAKRALYQGFELPIVEGCKVESEAFCNTMVSASGLAQMRRYTALPFDARRDSIDSQ
ncbi:MAG: enoyl-CoA hydratase/isomerase family protein [Alphaproteobacteria bacterium]|nr:enoyl-CoA hydratase/isomerase family protein [Alphaproteobacteria bacterium]